MGKVITFCITGFASAALLVTAGINMLQIHSQGSAVGNITTAEIYYHAMGWGFIGFGIFAFGLLIGMAFTSSQSPS